MDEYISKEKAMNLIEHNDKVCHYADERYENVVYATTQKICEVVAKMPAADVQPVNRWISIKESKPEDMQQVLAVVDGDTREAFYNAGCFIGSNFYRSINEVKWWQPLPKPPKDGVAE